MRCSSIGEPLFQPRAAPPRTEAADKAAPCDSPRRSASPPFLFLPTPFLAPLCAGRGGQTHEEAVGLICFPLSFHGREWDERLGFFFFFCIKKGNQKQLSQHCALAIYLNLFPFWLFNTVDRWRLKHWIAHHFSSALWIAQSFFFFFPLSESSSGYRDASIPQ